MRGSTGSIYHQTQRVLFACVFVVLVPFALWGQSDTGTISGAVTGSSGSLVAQVNIIVTDAKTNTAVFTTATDANGRYTAIALKPSDYVIAAEIAGFKREVRRGITLQVNQAAQVNFSLQVGQVSEVVEVTEAAPLMNTQSAELGDVVERRRVVDLPINGRFFAGPLPENW